MSYSLHRVDVASREELLQEAAAAIYSEERLLPGEGLIIHCNFYLSFVEEPLRNFMNPPDAEWAIVQYGWHGRTHRIQIRRALPTLGAAAD